MVVVDVPPALSGRFIGSAYSASMALGLNERGECLWSEAHSCQPGRLNPVHILRPVAAVVLRTQALVRRLLVGSRALSVLLAILWIARLPLSMTLTLPRLMLWVLSI